MIAKSVTLLRWPNITMQKSLRELEIVANFAFCTLFRLCFVVVFLRVSFAFSLAMNQALAMNQGFCQLENVL